MILESLLFAGFFATTAHATPSPLQQEAAPQQDQTQAGQSISLEGVEKQLADKPNDEALLLAAADLSAEKNDLPKADGYLKRALALDPKNFTIPYRLGVTSLMQKKFADAVSWLEKVRELEPSMSSDGNYLSLLAKAYMGAKTPQKAIDLLKPIEEHYPKSIGVHVLLSDAYSEAGNNDLAVEQAKTAYDLNPKDSRALNLLGYAYANQGTHLDEAVSLIKSALEQKPDDAAYLDSLGWAYFKQGKLQDALEAIQKAAAGLPDDSDVQDHLDQIKKALAQQQ